MALVTEEKIEMTPWEVHDMAVQVARDHLGRPEPAADVLARQPEGDPSIWFVGRSGRPEWVVVRPARFPAGSAERPDNWAAIASSCAQLGTTGHFASVAIASMDQPLQSSDEAPVPLWRGHGMEVSVTGLESATMGCPCPSRDRTA